MTKKNKSSALNHDQIEEGNDHNSPFVCLLNVSAAHPINSIEDKNMWNLQI